MFRAAAVVFFSFFFFCKLNQKFSSIPYGERLLSINLYFFMIKFQNQKGLTAKLEYSDLWKFGRESSIILLF